MGRGRKTQPTKVKALRGNPGRTPERGPEPEPSLSAGAAPCWLDDVARAKWNELVSELLATKVLTAVDETLLGTYCQTFSTFLRAQKSLKDNGLSTDGKRNPEALTANDCAVQMRLMGGELGLSPSSRVKLATDPQANREDSLESFLKVAKNAG